MKLVCIATFTIVFLFLLSTFVHQSMAIDADAAMKPTSNMNCATRCGARCSKSGHDQCMKYCQICCQKCNCVPSGTYGNKHECPCYRDMRNSKGNPKCP